MTVVYVILASDGTVVGVWADKTAADVVAQVLMAKDGLANYFYVQMWPVKGVSKVNSDSEQLVEPES